MKKLYFILFCLLPLFAFSSCGVKLDTSRYTSEEFRENNERLFLNEACMHDFEYYSASSLPDELDSNLYHMKYCNASGCDFEPVTEPHTLEVSEWTVSERATYRENGYFYHRMAISCKECKNLVEFYVYCPLQNPNCTKNGVGNTCLRGFDWKSLLADTPYILVDPPPTKTEGSEGMEQ